MSKSYDILVVGELNADLILRGDVTPEFGQVEKLLDDATLAVGSSSAIFACGAAQLGLKVAFMGKVGDDEFGRFMLNSMAKRGVNVSAVVVDSAIKTGLTVILSRGADRAMLTYLGGSIGSLRRSDVADSLLQQARHLHMGSYYLQGELCAETPALFQRAHKLGLTTSLDTNYDPTEQWQGGVADVLPHTDIFLPNEIELTRIGGSDEFATALQNLGRFGAKVIAKLGARGAMTIENGNVLTAPALKVDVVDTTGAGDTFDAGFLYGWLNGWEMQQSMRLGCVCGSLSAKVAGGVNGQPTLEEAMGRMRER